jgi:hypothetical protein
MRAPLIRAFQSPYLGLIAAAAVIVLGVVLTVTALSAARTEASLRARIAALSKQAQEASYWRAKLGACEASLDGGAKLAVTGLSAAERARRLAQTEPAGFDVCARMESADQAVLGTLK